MMPRTRSMILAAVVFALEMPASAHAASSAVLTITDVGWWSRRPGAAAQPPAYFEVASGLQGDESVAALRVPLAGAVLSATIDLAESGGVAQQTAALKICTTNAPWSPANPGAFADAPKADCGASVEPKRDASGRWGADITGLLASAGSSGSATLMVMPVPKPVGGLVDPGFNIQFTPAVVRAEFGSSSMAASNSTGARAPSTASSGSSPYPSLGVTAAPVVPPRGVVTASGSPATTVPAATSSTRPGQLAASFDIGVRTPGSGQPKPWGRLIWLVPLSAAGGIGAALARRRLAVTGI